MKDYLNEKREKEAVLLQNIHTYEQDIRTLHKQLQEWDAGEDGIYRFYHQSFKTFYLQDWTVKIVDLFKKLLDVPMDNWHPYFLEIYQSGIEKEFNQESNSYWTQETKPIVEAYLHVKHLLDMVIKYGLESSEAEREGTSGWFTVLYLYKIR